MAPLPMPERADAADASRLVELSVRRGWPLASLRKAPFEDRHAVLAGFALYAEAGKGDAADAAKKFLAGAGSFLSGTPEELMELALEYGWLAPDGAANFTVGPGATKRGLEAEIEFAETLRAERREKIRGQLQAKNREVNGPAAGFEPALEEDVRFMKEALIEAVRRSLKTKCRSAPWLCWMVKSSGGDGTLQCTAVTRQRTLKSWRFATQRHACGTTVLTGRRST